MINRATRPRAVVGSVGKLLLLVFGIFLVSQLLGTLSRYGRIAISVYVSLGQNHYRDSGEPPALERRQQRAIEAQHNRGIIGLTFTAAEKQGRPTGSADGALSVFLLTKSAPKNLERRRLARSGWISTAVFNSKCKCDISDTSRCTTTNQACRQKGLTWTHRFVCGSQHQDMTVNAVVMSEALHHGDVILYPEVETYNQLTWKTVWTLRFASRNVRSDYFILLDDDCYVQIWRVALYLQEVPRRRLYAGHVETFPPGVPRHFWNKWQISREQLDSERFPRYAWGAGIVLSSDVLATAVTTVNTWQKPWFMIEDAFLGVLLNASGVSVQHVPQLYTAGLYRRMGCRGDWADDVTQPLIITGDLEETKFLISARSRNESLCALLAGYQQDMARFYSSMNGAVVAWVCVAVVVCGVLGARWLSSAVCQRQI